MAKCGYLQTTPPTAALAEVSAAPRRHRRAQAVQSPGEPRRQVIMPRVVVNVAARGFAGGAAAGGAPDGGRLGVRKLGLWAAVGWRAAGVKAEAAGAVRRECRDLRTWVYLTWDITRAQQRHGRSAVARGVPLAELARLLLQGHRAKSLTQWFCLVGKQSHTQLQLPRACVVAPCSVPCEFTAHTACTTLAGQWTAGPSKRPTLASQHS